ncbi:hypothetical protein [Crenobacter cavernae]|uniref:hypothetical protein n=1 Tax=Crenobacter cavernae TaxID=2290923 RepID=UPI0015F13954|nr:hypothetical protein [Crenobacter cavernae]
MIVKLHKQARTTPAIREEIRHATGTLAELTARFNVSISTILKWKSRDAVEDRSHTAHRLQTTLTPAQERIAVELRKILRNSWWRWFTTQAVGRSQSTCMTPKALTNINQPSRLRQ